MKIKSNIIFFALIITSVFGFKVSDEVELDQYLNGRSGANFMKNANNVQTTLSKGTKGEVTEVSKTFATGNFGVKIKVSSGPKAGESYWVYYNKQNPGLRLVDKDDKIVSDRPETAEKAVVTRTIAARRDIEEQAVVDTATEAAVILNTDISSSLNQSQLGPCPTVSVPVLTTQTIQTPLVLEEPKAPQEPQISNDEVLEQFERVEPRSSQGCTRQSSGDGYKIHTIIDCKTSATLFSGGFSFNDGPGHPYLSGANSLYADGGKPRRSIEFISKDKASNETFLYLEDLAGGPDSHDQKSVVLLIPRKGVPSTKVEGDDVVVTLTTGEKVVFDKKTNAIKSGAMKEGPIDLTTDRFKRTPANVHYSGTGISIRVDHRFEYPTHGAATAVVQQGNRVCKVPKTKIWDGVGNLLPKDDQSLVKIINSTCPSKGSDRPFSI